MRPVAVFAAVALAALSGCNLAEKAGSDDSVKVLAIGNSFSVSVMAHLPAVAAQCAVKLDVASAHIGGCSLERHWENVLKDGEKDFMPYRFIRNRMGKTTTDRVNIAEALRMEKWDIVTIQQVSHYSWRGESFYPHGDLLVAKIRELAPTAKIFVQETWSYTPWDSRLKAWGFGPREMYDRLHRAYGAFAGKHSLPVIPMGRAVEEWRKRLPVKYAVNSLGGDVVGGGKLEERDHFRRTGDNKWKIYCDTFHLSRQGEYFQAMVWAKTLLGADLGKIKEHPGFVAHGNGELMKEIAMEL